jgi:hypothetical protein
MQQPDQNLPMRRPQSYFSQETRSLEAVLGAMDVPSLSEARDSGDGAAKDRAHDARRNRFPYSVVFQPFPLITWILPFAGHMGIADSAGRVYDFQGPFTIVRDRMMLGKATRFLRLDPGRVTSPPLLASDGDAQYDTWDVCVAQGVKEYSRRVHILCWDNCNHHSGYTLDQMAYGGCRSYGLVRLWILMAFKSESVGPGGLLRDFLPFCLFLGGLAFVFGPGAPLAYLGALSTAAVLVALLMYGPAFFSPGWRP